LCPALVMPETWLLVLKCRVNKILAYYLSMYF
jgi:hypothetical protein